MKPFKIALWLVFGAGFDGVVVLVSATSTEELSHGTNLGLGPDPPRPAARTACSWSSMHGADPARPRLAPLLPSPHFSAIAASPWSPAARMRGDGVRTHIREMEQHAQHQHTWGTPQACVGSPFFFEWIGLTLFVRMLNTKRGGNRSTMLSSAMATRKSSRMEKKRSGFESWKLCSNG